MAQRAFQLGRVRAELVSVCRSFTRYHLRMVTSHQSYRGKLNEQKTRSRFAGVLDCVLFRVQEKLLRIAEQAFRHRVSMSHSTTVAAAILIAFFVFITIRGELPKYMGVLGI